MQRKMVIVGRQSRLCRHMTLKFLVIQGSTRRAICVGDGISGIVREGYSWRYWKKLIRTSLGGRVNERSVVLGEVLAR